MSEQCQWGPGDGIGRYCLTHESWMRAVIGTRCPVGELTTEVEVLRKERDALREVADDAERIVGILEAQVQRVRDMCDGIEPDHSVFVGDVLDALNGGDDE